MTPHPGFAVGSRVAISGAAGVVVGKVDLSITPEELPDLAELTKQMGLPPVAAGGPAADVVRSILREMAVDRMVLVRHLHSGREVCFFALHCAFDDCWRDLQSHDLTVKPYAETN